MIKLVATSLLGATGVALGALGAHGLKPMLEASGRVETWDTAALYHLIHALGLLALAAGEPRLRSRWTFRLWVTGTVIFSGSLYTLCLSGWTFLGAITPIGGVALIAGWIALFLENRRSAD